jgi:AraC-like DNA-binding protein
MRPIPFEFPLIANGQTFMVWEDIFPCAYHEFHYHKETQITLIINGSGNLFLQDNVYPFKARDLYIIGANQPHVFKTDPYHLKRTFSDPSHIIHVIFDHQKILTAIDGLPELRNIANFLRDAQHGLQLRGPVAIAIADRLMAIKNTSQFDSFIELMHIWFFFAENRGAWKPLLPGALSFRLFDIKEARLQDICRYTIDHYYEEISLKEIACIATLSIPAFCKFFKKHTHKTYFSFLNEIRISEACKKMHNNYYDSVSSIAYSTGFNNPITFNRVFKKIIGKTPTAYKEQCREAGIAVGY